MTSKIEALVQHAQAQIGKPFRRGGQASSHGFDCIGLVRHCLISAGCKVPSLPHYGMRQSDIAPFGKIAKSAGLQGASGAIQAGDVLVLQPSCAQHHLAIAVPNGRAVHAHAGLRRVTESRLPLPWPIVAIWRFKDTGDTLWQHSS